MIRAFACVTLISSLAYASAGAAAVSPTVTVSLKSKKLLFTAAVTHPAPLPVEKLHSWTVRLLDRKHAPVTHARIKVSGDMPEHGHGLPTSPVAVNRGRGVYQLQGMMFQMPGRWYVQLDVRTATRHDTIRIAFTIRD
jgi:hypothetical protein